MEQKRAATFAVDKGTRVQGAFHKQALKVEEGSLVSLTALTLEIGMETWIDERFVPFLMRLLFVFEPLTPRFVSFSLERRLKEWKDKRLIDNYSVKTGRIGKFHYKVDMDLVLTPEQARNLMIKIFKRIRR